jgi:hypothetical protein
VWYDIMMMMMMAMMTIFQCSVVLTCACVWYVFVCVRGICAAKIVREGNWASWCKDKNCKRKHVLLWALGRRLQKVHPVSVVHRRHVRKVHSEWQVRKKIVEAPPVPVAPVRAHMRAHIRASST